MRQSDEMAQWTAQQEWERAHPKPVNNDTVNDYKFIAQMLGEDALLDLQQALAHLQREPIALQPVELVRPLYRTGLLGFLHFLLGFHGVRLRRRRPFALLVHLSSLFRERAVFTPAARHAALQSQGLHLGRVFVVRPLKLTRAGDLAPVQRPALAILRPAPEHLLHQWHEDDVNVRRVFVEVEHHLHDGHFPPNFDRSQIGAGNPMPKAPVSLRFVALREIVV